MGEALRRDHADERARAILAGVLARDRRRERVGVAREHLALQRLCRRDGEDPGAGADIEDHGWALPLEEIVKREQAAARARMMGRAEGLARVDLEGETASRHASAVM